MATASNVNTTERSHQPQIKQGSDAEREIDLLELFYRLLERAKYIILVALAGALAAAFYSFVVAVPMYEATSKLYVLNSGDSAVNLSDLQIGSYLASDYQEVFSTWEVHQMVVENLGLDYTYQAMQSMLSITNPGDTRILYITVKNASGELAAQIANEYASVAQTFISETMATEEPNLLSAALVPSAPISPNKTRNTVLGFLLGAIVACGVFTVQFLMDDKIRTAEDIERYIGLPTLAAVPIQGRGAQAQSARRAERG